MDTINLEKIITDMPMYKEYKYKIIKAEDGLRIDDAGASFFKAMFNTKKCDGGPSHKYV